MEYKDYYKILGVERGANSDEIKRAYKKLARKYHPDVSKEADAEERFKEINEAYQVLKDPEKRKAYDQLGAGWQEGQDFRPPPGWEQHFHRGGPGEEDVDLGGFSDFFEEIFRGRGGGGGFHYRRGNANMRGEDMHAGVRVHLEDAYNGAQRTITLQVPEVDAQGRVVQRPKQLNVRIPKGIREGQQIRLAGQGGPGLGQGTAGDLYLEVHFEPHRLFHVESKDIFLDLPITPWEAALGAKVQVPTLGGKVGVSIPEGSQSGRKLRLKGRGLPGSPPGDQYIVLHIETPPAHSEHERELYRKMAEEMPFDPRKNRGI